MESNVTPQGLPTECDCCGREVPLQRRYACGRTYYFCEDCRSLGVTGVVGNPTGSFVLANLAAGLVLVYVKLQSRLDEIEKRLMQLTVQRDDGR